MWTTLPALIRGALYSDHYAHGHFREGIVMRVITSPIPEGSHGVRVWIHEPAGPDEPEDKPDFDFACNLLRLSDDECEAAQALGELNNDVAIQIGLKALELGYKRLTFRRSMGGLATRWAKFSHTDGGMDYYTVDLIEAMQIYRQRST